VVEIAVNIVIGSDQAGFELKEQVRQFLSDLGHKIRDVGTDNLRLVDGPDYVEAVATAVLEGTAARGVLICGSGFGASVAANQFPGIRAGLCHDHYSVRQSVEHLDMNVLVLNGRLVGQEIARELVAAFVNASYQRRAA
jgi:RpiB/LacA/LacB family sugar-phosphate isomerase